MTSMEIPLILPTKSEVRLFFKFKKFNKTFRSYGKGIRVEKDQIKLKLII